MSQDYNKVINNNIVAYHSLRRINILIVFKNFSNFLRPIIVRAIILCNDILTLGQVLLLPVLHKIDLGI